MVEEMLAARGIEVSHETVRQWALKFGQSFANQIRRRLPAPGDKWHLDEVVISIAGRKHWLWRAVDRDGYVLDEIVQQSLRKLAIFLCNDSEIPHPLPRLAPSPPAPCATTSAGWKYAEPS